MLFYAKSVNLGGGGGWATPKISFKNLFIFMTLDL